MGAVASGEVWPHSRALGCGLKLWWESVTRPGLCAGDVCGKALEWGIRPSLNLFRTHIPTVYTL